MKKWFVWAVLLSAGCQHGGGVDSDKLDRSPAWEDAAVRTVRLFDGDSVVHREWEFAVIDDYWYARFEVPSSVGPQLSVIPLYNMFELTVTCPDFAACAETHEFITSAGGYILNSLRGYSVAHWGEARMPAAGDKPYLDVLDAYLSRPDLFRTVTPERTVEPPDSFPRYTGYSFYVTLREGYAVSDLKKLDDESRLPLSSATYDAHAAYGGDIVINFTCCYNMLDDAEKVAATLESLPPVLHARPVTLAVMSRRARS
jgi:hypothetical protein